MIGDDLDAEYDRLCESDPIDLAKEIERLRKHSVALNELGWRIAVAAGVANPGDESWQGDPRTALSRLVAERDYNANIIKDWESRFPCDKSCRDYPEETCSQHGRKPADIWQVVTEVQAQRDAAKAELAQERQFCAASGHPRTAAAQIIREHGEYRAGVAAALAFADEMQSYCSPHGVAQDWAQRLRERVETAMKETGRG